MSHRNFTASTVPTAPTAGVQTYLSLKPFHNSPFHHLNFKILLFNLIVVYNERIFHIEVFYFAHYKANIRSSRVDKDRTVAQVILPFQFHFCCTKALVFSEKIFWIIVSKAKQIHMNSKLWIQNTVKRRDQVHTAWPSAKLEGQRNESSRAELHRVLYADDNSLIQQANLNVTRSCRWELGVPHKTRSRQTADRIMREIIRTFAPPACFRCSRAFRKSVFPPDH